MGLFGKIDTFNLERLGPFCDVVVGTDGRYTDLNQAISDGHTRIILGEGAILTANLSLTAATGFIVSPGSSRNMDLGAFTLSVESSNWHFEGFEISGASGSGIVVSSGNSISIERCDLNTNGVHGVHIQSPVNNVHLSTIRCSSNTGDGVRMDSGTDNTMVLGSYCSFNTGYGINDLDNSSIVVACRIEGNTAGGINGTPEAEAGNIEQA